jgi:hypothetical protein
MTKYAVTFTGSFCAEGADGIEAPDVETAIQKAEQMLDHWICTGLFSISRIEDITDGNNRIVIWEEE